MRMSSPESDQVKSVSDLISGYIKIVREASKEVPAVRYAFGVVGIAAAAAAVGALFRGSWLVSVLALIGVLFGSVILFVFGWINKNFSDSPVMKPIALTLSWFSLLILMLFTSFMMSSVFFNWPLPLSGWIASSASSDQSEANSTPSLYISNWIGYAPLYVAKVDNQLPSWEINDEQHLSRDERRQKIESREFHFFGGPIGEFVIDIAQQSTLNFKPVMFLVIAQQNGGDAVISSDADVEFENIDWMDVSVGGWASGTSHYLLLYRLETMGLDSRKVKFSHVDSVSELLERFGNGQFDIIVTWTPWAEIAEKRGGTVIARGGGEHGPPETFAILSATDRSYIKEFDDELKELFAAWDYGLTKIESNPTEVYKTLAPWLELSRDEVEVALSRVKFFSPQQSLNDLNYREKIQLVEQQAKLAGLRRAGEATNLETDTGPLTSYVNAKE